MTDGGVDAAAVKALDVLAQDVGVWDVEMAIYPAPDAEPFRRKATSTSRMIGGRWLVTDHQTESGFEGHGVCGWDAGRGTYVATWVDSSGGGIASATGRWDDVTRTMTLDFEVELDGRVVRYRRVTESPDEDTRLYRNVMARPDGGEYDAIVSTYRRR
jgi:hypothetical protein